MAYLDITALQALIPEPDLTKALDDDADGVIDAFDMVAAQASAAVDGLLSLRYTVPFTDPNIPQIVTQAAKIFAAELCYKRRSVSDESNPWFGAAERLRSMLAKIGAGELPLAPAEARAMPSATIITEHSRTASRHGGMIG